MSNGSHYAHACHPEVIEHAVCDDAGKVTTPEKRKLRENIRNEHYTQGVFFLEGKLVRRAPHQEERGQYVFVPADSLIISEGLGREAIE